MIKTPAIAVLTVTAFAIAPSISRPVIETARVRPDTTVLEQQVEQVPASCIPAGFGEAIQRYAIDSVSNGCGLRGKGTGATADDREKQEVQNLVKNNFCAWKDGEPALVTMKSFDQLQRAIPQGFPWGSRTRMPTAAERTQLKDIYTTSEGAVIGEGSYVQFVGFLLEGHPGSAESVTCSRNKKADVDIHLAFASARPSAAAMADRGATECKSITAEISAHHRPVEWDVLRTMTGKPATKKLIGAQERLGDEDLQRPLRIRGQLFFDSSHVICKSGAPVGKNPPRRSGWEIHPIYSVDVCSKKTLAACDISDESLWTPLADWWEAEDGDQ
jgi:hypothetical protein